MRIASVVARDSADVGAVVELRKWETYYQTRGIEIIRAAGSPDYDSMTRFGDKYVVVEGLDPSAPGNQSLMQRILSCTDPAAFPVIDHQLEELASALESNLAEMVKRFDVDTLHVDAMLSYPVCLPFNIAALRLADEFGLKIISRAHDFVWERVMADNPYLIRASDSILPPVREDVLHVTLTDYARRELVARRHAGTALAVPNLFDFTAAARRHRGAELRARIGVSNEGLLVLQPTRCLPTKGVHHALHCASIVGRALGREPVVLVTGSTTGLGGRSANDIGSRYRAALVDLAAELQVRLQFMDGSLVECAEIGHGENFCVGDAYSAADLVSYVSVCEGFGNPVVESTIFRRPLVVSNYPVLEEEFTSRGLDFDIVGRDPVSTVNPREWTFDMRRPVVDVGDLERLIDRLRCGYADSGVAESNFQLARSLYENSRENIEGNLAPILSWRAGVRASCADRRSPA